jgi:hypothetical protein
VILVASACASACALLVGIHDHDFTVAEAGAEASAETGPSRCAHASPPPRPTIADTDVRKSFLLAVRRIGLSGRNDAGDAVGFDLDGVCTCDPADDTIRRGAPSCDPPPDALREGGCDDDGGIDNGLAAISDRVLNFPGADRFDSLINGSIDCGKETVLLYVAGYNGAADDPDVSISVIVSFGIYEDHDGDAGCPWNGLQPYPAKWDGLDTWSVPDGSISNSTGQPLPTPPYFEGWVKDFHLVVDYRSDPSAPLMPLVFGGKPIENSSPALVARIVPLDDRYAELPLDQADRATHYKLVDGVLAGRVNAASLLTSIGGFHTSAGKFDHYFCDPADLKPLFYDPVKAIVCKGRESVISSTFDFKPDQRCDSVSIVAQFSAEPARFGSSSREASLPDAGSCAETFKDSCDDDATDAGANDADAGPADAGDAG